MLAANRDSSRGTRAKRNAAAYAGAVYASILTCSAICAASFLSCTPARAQTAADFYKGKRIMLVVGSTAGGGYDAYARLLARFLATYIPGNPTIVVQNMPGGGSLRSVLYLNQGAPKDGTVMTIFNPGIITDSIVNPAEAKVKFSDFAWVGSVTPDLRICYMGKATGIATFDDMGKSGHQVTLGATGQASLTYNDTQMLKNVFKRNVRGILGYPGRSEVHLAIERGELDGECGSISGLPNNWLVERKINIPTKLVDEPMPGVPDSVPYIGTFAKTAEEREILKTLTAANELGRPFIASRDVPQDRVAVLRKAFDQAMQDKEFLSVAGSQNLTVLPMSGPKAQALVNSLYGVPADIAEKARKAIY